MLISPEEMRAALASASDPNQKTPSVSEQQQKSVRIERGGAEVDVPADTVPFSEAPWYEDLARGVVFGGFDGLAQTFDTIEDIGNAFEEGVLGLEEDEGFFGERTFREYVGLEEGDYNPEQLGTVGQIAAGFSSFGVGLIPGFGTVGLGLRGATALGKGASAVAKVMGKAPGGNVLNMGSGTSRFRELVRTGAAGAIGEQFAFDPQDPRLSNMLAESDIPFLDSIGQTLAANKDDPESLQRIKMAAEGLGIGLIFEGATIGVRAFGRRISNKADPDEMSLADYEAASSIDKGSKLDPADATPLVQKRAAKRGVELTAEELEEFTGYMQEPGFAGQAKAIDWLTTRGLYDPEMEKYYGSINATRIQTNELEAMNVIKETAETLTEAERKTNLQTLEDSDALLFGVDTREELLNALEKNAESPLVLHQKITGGVQLSADLSGLTAYAVASRKALVRSADYVVLAAQEAKLMREAGEEGYLQAKGAFLQALFAHRSLQETVTGIASESGRLQQSFNIPISSSNKADYLKELIQEGGQDVDKLIDKASQPDMDALAFEKMIRDGGSKEEATFGAKMKEYWYNSILSSFDTQLVNTGGNLGVALARNLIEGTLSASMGTVRRALGARAEDVTTFGDVAQRIRGITAGRAMYDPTKGIMKDLESPEGLQLLNARIEQNIRKGKHGPKNYDDVVNGLKAQGIEEPYDELKRIAKQEIELEAASGATNFLKALRLAKEAFGENATARARFAESGMNEFVQTGGAGVIKGTFGQLIRVPTRMMSFGDTYFKAIAQTGALYEEANRMLRRIKREIEEGTISEIKGVDATMKFKYNKMTKEFFEVPIEGADGKINPKSYSYGALVERLVENPTQEMLDRANKIMLEDVFQQETALTQGTLKLRQMLDSIPGVPFGTVLIPFVKTPLNIMHYAFDRLPVVALISKQNRQALKEGGVGLDQVVARQTAGALYMSGAFMLAQEGLITGAGPTDPKIRANLLRSGWQPFSIKIGDKYYSYTRLDPFAMFAGFAADIQRASIQIHDSNLSDAEKKDLLRLAGGLSEAAVSSFTLMLSDKTYLKNIGEIGEAIFNPQKGDTLQERIGGAILADVPANAAAGFVPAIVGRAAEQVAALTTDPKKEFQEIDAMSKEDREKYLASVAKGERDAPGADAAATFYDPVLRETYVESGVITKIIAAATAKTPKLREALGVRLFPSVDQFGEDRLRNQGWPLPIASVSRLGNPKENQAIFEELYKNNVPYKFTSKKIKMVESDQEIELPREWYYYRTKLEGAEYIRKLKETISGSIYQKFKEKGDTRGQQTLLKSAKKAAEAYALAKIYQPGYIENIYKSIGLTLEQDRFNAMYKRRDEYNKQYESTIEGIDTGDIERLRRELEDEESPQ